MHARRHLFSSFTYAVSLSSGPLARSLSSSLTPSSVPCLQTPSRSKLSTAHHATRRNTIPPPSPLLETLLYVSISFSLFIFLFILAVSFRLLFRSQQRHFDDDAECEEDGEEMRDRRRESDGEMDRESANSRRQEEEGKGTQIESGEETALSRTRWVRRGQRYNCI